MSDAPLIEANFYCDGKFVGQAVQPFHPHYIVGDTFELQQPPSDRDLTRHPAREFRSRFFVIERVHQIVAEDPRNPMAFRYKIDVILAEPDEDADLEEFKEQMIAARKNRRKSLIR